MDSATKLNIPKMEKTIPEFDWTFEQISQLPQLNTCFEFDVPLLLCPNMSIDFDGFEDCFGWDNNLPCSYEDMVVDTKPLKTSLLVDNVEAELAQVPVVMSRSDQSANSSIKGVERRMSGTGTRRKKSAPLQFEEIQKHFDVPITKAAKKMNVGLTMLKKRCRELNIMRWPHRKIKSLKSLINNFKELGLANDEIMMLEEHTSLVERVPNMGLADWTKKLRQAFFKANYKKRKVSIATS